MASSTAAACSDVDPAAMSRIVEQGYHPDLGARALKRAIERQLTGPIAARLAALAPDAPTVVSIYPSGAGGIAPQVQPLVNAAPIDPPLSDRELEDLDLILDRVEDYLNDAEAASAATEPAPASRVSTANLSPRALSLFRRPRTNPADRQTRAAG